MSQNVTKPKSEWAKPQYFKGSYSQQLKEQEDYSETVLHFFCGSQISHSVKKKETEVILNSGSTTPQEEWQKQLNEKVDCTKSNKAKLQKAKEYTNVGEKELDIGRAGPRSSIKGLGKDDVTQTNVTDVEKVKVDLQLPKMRKRNLPQVK